MGTKNMIVFIEEEYGYRYWLWSSGKTEEELLAWWSELESVHPFFHEGGKSLPFGVIARLHEEEITVLSPGQDPEQSSRYLGFTADIVMHLHTDGDSYLYNQAADSYLYHKGFDKDYYSAVDDEACEEAFENMAQFLHEETEEKQETQPVALCEFWDQKTWSDQELHDFVSRLYTSQMERELQKSAKEEIERRKGNGPALATEP